ncbi:BCCT family transporter [Streptomyces carpaticus]|uniref:BCCT family transporter n=1 Tax=Streptomyces carpaticus TaxID=285558 RepID=A0ABV4ZRE5_9ACTN
MSDRKPTQSPAKPPRLQSIAPWVFWPSVAIIGVFVLWAIIWDKAALRVVNTINSDVVGNLGWYYMVLVSLFVIFVIWVGLSRFGDIKLGKDNDKPDFSTASWLAMLFAAGMGIGLVYWGVAEPLTFYDSPRPGVEGGEAEASRAAFSQTFLHWGIHPWAIYVVVGLAIAYAVHRKGHPVSIRWTLEPLLGDKVKGRAGDVIDIVALVGTVFGVATSLGFGVLQISAGADFLGWADNPGTALQVALIVGITLLAVVSVLSGVGKGIKWLSNINMGLFFGLMLFVLLAGSTTLLLSDFTENIGFYLQSLPSLSFDTGAAHGEDGKAWVSGWTVFYWGWWISWAPFVGIFIARISKGRTVRQFVAGVLLVPSLLTFFWFSVIGGSGVNQERTEPGSMVGADGVDKDSALFSLLDHFPGGALVAGVAMLLIVLFFVTSSDSGSYVVDMLASGGDPEPPRWSRAFWACAQGVVAIALLVAAGSDALTTLQTVAIIIALPFSLVMIAMCIATLKQFRAERAAYLAAQRRETEERLIEEAVAALEEAEKVDKAAELTKGAKAPVGGRTRR